MWSKLLKEAEKQTFANYYNKRTQPKTKKQQLLQLCF